MATLQKVMRRRPIAKKTHFLRIPFATAMSTPQLIDLRTRLMQDPIAAAIPRPAWSEPDEIQWTIECLSLETPSRLHRAIQLLQGLDINRIADEIAISPDRALVSEEAATLDGHAAHDSRTMNETLRPSEAPSISLWGLCTKSEHDLSATKDVRAHIRESRPFLKQFTSRISRIFREEDLVAVGREQGPKHLDTIFLDTKYLLTDVINQKPSMKGRGFYRKPYFDLSDLRPENTDLPWTTEFPLERLCISELGLKDCIRKGKVVRTCYRDIASVPLPGSDPTGAPTENPGDSYIKAAKSFKKNAPICPMIIPSRPVM